MEELMLIHKMNPEESIEGIFNEHYAHLDDDVENDLRILSHRYNPKIAEIDPNTTKATD